LVNVRGERGREEGDEKGNGRRGGDGERMERGWREDGEKMERGWREERGEKESERVRE
jgi:hypothetical protein